MIMNRNKFTCDDKMYVHPDNDPIWGHTAWANWENNRNEGYTLIKVKVYDSAGSYQIEKIVGDAFNTFMYPEVVITHSRTEPYWCIDIMVEGDARRHYGSDYNLFIGFACAASAEGSNGNGEENVHVHYIHKAGLKKLAQLTGRKGAENERD